MLCDELVVIQQRIRCVDSIDLLQLPRRERLVGIKTNAVGEEPLSAQNFMNSRDAAAKLMSGIKDGSIGVGNFSTPCKHSVEPRTIALHFLDSLQQFDGSARPAGPLTQQASDKMGSAIAKATMLSSFPV